MINNFKNKKILILGLGLNEGGLGSTRFFAKHGAQVKVTDLRSEQELKKSLDELSDFPEIDYTLGEHKYEDIDWADLIIRNPAIKPDNPYLLYAQEKGKNVEMDIGVFLDFVRKDQIIGITGTKGKTTTASLIYEAIRMAPHFRRDEGGGGDDKGVVLAGNIGKSVLDALDVIDCKTLVVLELSSFQLQSFNEKKLSPHFAVITNIYPDHLNYHQSMEEYVNLKKVIAKYQDKNDYLFINKDNLMASPREFLQGFGGNVIYFSRDDLPKDYKTNLPGDHNKVNYAAALKVAVTLGVTKDAALRNMNNFSGADFRLQKVYDQNGIKIINDSSSTMPDSTIEALKTFNNAILICGGMDKNLDYEKLAFQIDRSVKAVYFIEGTATDKIIKSLKHMNILRSAYNNLERLLRDAKLEAKKGDVILFSPGATSFNFFQNEFDRGRKFNALVEKIFGISN